MIEMKKNGMTYVIKRGRNLNGAENLIMHQNLGVLWCEWRTQEMTSVETLFLNLAITSLGVCGSLSLGFRTKISDTCERAQAT